MVPQLIVGLGNPGKEYEDTRHNAGFFFVDALAEAWKTHFAMQTKFFGQVAKAQVHGKEVWLLKPTTFMNRSGQSVAALTQFYKLPPQTVLAVHDELDIQPGEARLKVGGGAGGHRDPAGVGGVAHGEQRGIRHLLRRRRRLRGVAQSTRRGRRHDPQRRSHGARLSARRKQSQRRAGRAPSRAGSRACLAQRAAAGAGVALSSAARRAPAVAARSRRGRERRGLVAAVHAARRKRILSACSPWHRDTVSPASS